MKEMLALTPPPAEAELASVQALPAERDVEYYCGEPWYWKCNRVESQVKLVPVRRDKKLFDKGRRSAPQPRNILSYRPESHIAFAENRGDDKWFCKMYKASNLDRAARAARIVDKHLNEHSVPLVDMDESCLLVRWKWVDRENSTVLDAPEVVDLASAVHTIPTEVGQELPKLTAVEIASHIQNRINSFSTWTAQVGGSVEKRFDELRNLAEDVIVRVLTMTGVEKTYLIHGDFRPKNTMKDASGKLYLYDCDHLVRGEREWDYACWAAGLGQRDEDRAAHFLNEAIDKASVRKELLQAYYKAWRVLMSLKHIEENPA